MGLVMGEGRREPTEYCVSSFILGKWLAIIINELSVKSHCFVCNWTPQESCGFIELWGPQWLECFSEPCGLRFALTLPSPAALSGGLAPFPDSFLTQKLKL